MFNIGGKCCENSFYNRPVGVAVNMWIGRWAWWLLSATNGSRSVIRGLGVARRGSGSAPDGAARVGRINMLGAMMYPGAEEAELEDMRVPPIQLEHLPEVFLCT